MAPTTWTTRSASKLEPDSGVTAAKQNVLGPQLSRAHHQAAYDMLGGMR